MTKTQYIVFCRDYRTGEFEEQETFDSEEAARTYCEESLNPDVAYKITKRSLEETELWLNIL